MSYEYGSGGPVPEDPPAAPQGIRERDEVRITTAAWDLLSGGGQLHDYRMSTGTVLRMEDDAHARVRWHSGGPFHGERVAAEWLERTPESLRLAAALLDEKSAASSALIEAAFVVINSGTVRPDAHDDAVAYLVYSASKATSDAEATALHLLVAALRLVRAAVRS